MTSHAAISNQLRFTCLDRAIKHMQRRGVGAMANVHVSDARREQLQADRDFTRAISMYLKDRRARFERQLVGHFKNNQK